MKAVLFDMGDTLLHGFHDGKLGDLCERTGSDYPHLQPLLNDIAAAFAQERADNLTTMRQPRSFEDVFKDVWLPVSQEYPGAFQVSREIFETFTKPAELFPETLEALEMLYRRGYKLGIVSNVSFRGHNFIPMLVVFRIHWYFRATIFSTDVTVRKPHPAIFRHTLNLLGVKPEDAVMVGDQIARDVVGAHAVGMKAVWINRTKQKRQKGEEKPDWTIKDLRELVPILESLS